MTKKIILLLCTLFYINGTFAEEKPLPLTPQETTAYNEIMKKYEQNKQLSREEMDQFLKEKNLSSQELYSILGKKYVILQQEDHELLSIAYPQAYRYGYYHHDSARFGDSYGYTLAFLASIAAFFAASPIVATGLAIQNYMAPSPTQKIISSGLIGTGAIIGSAIPIYTGVFAIAGSASKLREAISSGIGGISEATSRGLSSLYESFTHKKQTAQIEQQAIQKEIQKVTYIMNYLKSLYPELS